MGMSRGDFEKFAKMIKDTSDEHWTDICAVGTVLFDVAGRIADICAEDNPNFNRDRFFKACGFED